MNQKGKLGNQFKRGLAGVLTTTMVVGMMAGIMPGNVAVVQAASVTPSITAYATKTQLMENFKPNENGTANTLGKLRFGKNSKGETQEWYILGKDSGMTNDNIAIFAANNITTGTFNSPKDKGNAYETSNLRSNLQGIAKNSSYFSSAEQNLMQATEVIYSMSNETTSKGSDKLYVPSLGDTYDSYSINVCSNDIPLVMDNYWSTGDSFWTRTGGIYWTFACYVEPKRTEYLFTDASVDGEKGVRPASNLAVSSVLFASAAVVPSSGMSKGTISNDAAMTLRLDGSGKNIGTVAYNTTTGTVKATKGSGSGTTVLVVQGKDGTKDWYYSKVVSGTETITTSTLQSSLSLSSVPDLSKCKIWMETTTDSVTYAVNAMVAPNYTIPTMTAKEIAYNKTLNDVYTSTNLTNLLGSPKANGTSISGTWSWVNSTSTKVGNLGEKTFQAKFTPNNTALNQYIWDDVTGWDASGKCIKVAVPIKVVESPISSVAITNITAPVANTTLDTTASCSTTGVSSTTPGVSWSPTPNGEKAGFNTIHTASVTLSPAYGYKFTTATTAKVNSGTATSVKMNADGTLTVTKEFSATAKRKITEITAPTVPANKTFTNYYTELTVVSASEFGKAVATFEAPEISPATANMDVTWTVENYDEEPYDPTPGAKNIFRWTVKPGEYTNYDVTSNNIVLTGKVSIRNKAATSVSITGTDASVSYNSAGIDVSQYFNYDNNVGAVTYSLVPKSEDATVTGEGELTGSTLKVTKVGDFKVKLSTEAQGNYAIAEKTITLTVEKGIISNMPQSTMDVSYINRKVSDLTPPEGWSWQTSDETKVLEVGTAVTATAVYTGADKGNYVTESVVISITRQACAHDGETEVEGAKEATCTESGCTGDIYCKICQEKIKETEKIDALGHDMAKVISAKEEATCTTDGREALMGCTRCDHTEGGGVVKALDHAYVNGVCSGCDKIWEEVVNGITYQAITTVDENGKPVGQTVTVSGNDVPQVAIAVVKGDVTDTNKVIIPSEVTGSGSNQNFVVTKVEANAFEETTATEIVVPGTVTEVGAGAFGDVKVVTFRNATAPRGVKEAVSEDATVNVPEGAKESYQSALGDGANIVEVHTHTYAATWTYHESGHWKSTTCGHDNEEGALDIQSHTFGDWTVIEEATEDAKGLRKRSCACGYTEAEEMERLAHTTHIKGEGTRVEPTCEKKGSITYKCTKCGEVMEVVELAAKGHTWDAGKVTKEATETEEGVRTDTCTVCGKTKTETIPKKAATPQPPKDDTVAKEPLKNGDVRQDDKNSAKYEVTDAKKKEVTYKEPVDKKAKTVTIPPTVKIDGETYKVTGIADNAFADNKTVTRITIGSNVRTIGKNAFSGATKLKKVTIGKNVTEIGANAFKECTSLTSVTLPGKVAKIGANAFNGCKKLKTLTIKSTKLTSKKVSKNAFKGLTKVTTIKVLNKKLGDYKKLFKSKGLSSKVTVKSY